MGRTGVAVFMAAILSLALAGRSRPTSSSEPIASDTFWVGVIGDSSVTGAAASPDVEASWKALFTQILKLDSPQLAFPYLVARDLGARSQDIVIAGQDGAMVETFSLQLNYLKQVRPTLPPLLLISFVANDLCDPEVFKKPKLEFAAKYREDIRSALARLQTSIPDPRGTRLVLQPPLDVAEILSNPKLLAQEVKLEGHPISCADLRESERAPSYLARGLQEVLIHECPAILTPTKKVGDRVTRIRELQQEQMRVLAEETNAFNARQAPKLSLVLAESVRHIDFQTGDLAGDCFHPSVQGHRRIADQLLTHELAAGH